MKKIIIFDGPDKCGKTEMATELSNRINYPYFKNKSEWDAFEKDPGYFLNALKYGDTYFFNYLKQTGSKVILDRSFPSEWCYSRVFNRSTDEKVLRQVDNLAAAAGACIIIPYRTSYSGIHDDVHEINEQHLKLLSAAYEEFAEWTTCKVLRLCVDSEDINYEMNQILSFIMRG